MKSNKEKKSEKKTQKNINNKEKLVKSTGYLINVVILCVIAVVLALAVELISNIKLMTLPTVEKGIIPYDFTEVAEYDKEVTSENMQTEALDIVYEVKINNYVDKLLVEYDNEFPVYMEVEVEYTNCFGADATESFTDKNPSYLNSTYIRLNKDVNTVRIRLLDEGFATSDVDIERISVKNTAQFNIFRFMFVFMSLLCVGLLLIFRSIIAIKTEYAFLIIALCAGVTMSLLMPISRISWDEETHLRGVYFLDITGSLEYNTFTEAFISAGMENNPYEYSTTIEEYDAVMQAVNENTVISDGDEIKSHSWMTSSFGTFAYMIMAVTCNICKLAGVPFGIMYMLVRLTNLLTYIITVFFAVRKLPKGKLLMCAIALMPTPMFLAANVSYDSIVTGFTYLGLAYLFSMVLENKKITWWEYLVFVGAMGYGSLPKALYIPLILMGLFIPHNRFKDKKTEKLMKAGIIIAFIALMSTFVLPTLISPSEVGDNRGGDTSHAGQIGMILSNPLAYAGILLSTIWEHLGEYTIGTSSMTLLAHLGSGSLTYIIAAYLIFLTVTSENIRYIKNDNANTEKMNFTPIFKLSLWVLIFGVVCLIWTAMFLSFTEVGKTVIAGVQGRYYIPLIFPALFALSFNKFSSGYDKRKYNLMCLLVSVFIIFYTICEGILVKCCL